MDIRLENLTASRATGHLRLIPNINSTGRALPDVPTSDDLVVNVRVDCERPTRQLSDREIYSLIVDISDEEAAADPAMTLEVSYDPMRFQLLNASAIPLGGQDSQPLMLNLPEARKDNTKSRGLQYFIEAQTFNGSPLLDAKSNPSMSFRILGQGGKVLLDKPKLATGDIRAADVILLGDDAPAERVFICDVGENGPSISEFSKVAQLAKVPLTVVPLDIGNGDAWIQDQFQMGYTANNQANKLVIVHLPRLVNDSAIVAGTANLRNFVDTYFPSESIGVMKDFWKFDIKVSDMSGVTSMTVVESYLVYKYLNQTTVLLSRLFNLLQRLNPSAATAIQFPKTIFEQRLAIEIIAKIIAQQNPSAAELRLQMADVQPAIGLLSKFVGLNSGSLVLNVSLRGSAKTLTFMPTLAAGLQDFYKQLDDLHSSHNYGGNIEVSPPTPDAKYGKILAGSVSSSDLMQFLTSRGSTHPLFSVNTNWLEVGHIDEIAAFATHPSDDFCLLRASPDLAIQMLRGVVELQKSGVAVTRVLRGKKWPHKSKAGATDPLKPPKAYFELVKSKIYDLSGFKKNFPSDGSITFGDGAFYDDRRFFVVKTIKEVDEQYVATMTCADVLTLCEQSNRAAEDLFLSNSNQYARTKYQTFFDDEGFRKNVIPFRLEIVANIAFRGIKILPLPVMFDSVDDWHYDKSSAILPAMVNFQTLGTFVAVPRPYGPRLHVNDALKFVNSVVADLGYPKSRIDEQYIRTRGLDKTWHWTRKGEKLAHASLQKDPTSYDLQGKWESPFGMLWLIEHENDPIKNHPKLDFETLEYIAGFYKDGFDAFKNVPVDFCKGDTEDKHPSLDNYKTEIKKVMELIRDANQGVFDNDGNILSENWQRISIPEDTVDVFELYAQFLMEALGLTVCWVDSWYYHTHKGGIHCGTNVLRRFSG